MSIGLTHSIAVLIGNVGPCKTSMGLLVTVSDRSQDLRLRLPSNCLNKTRGDINTGYMITADICRICYGLDFCGSLDHSVILETGCNPHERKVSSKRCLRPTRS